MKKLKTEIKINPNKNIRDFVYTDLIAKRPHSSSTPSKRGLQIKLDRRAKQIGWC